MTNNAKKMKNKKTLYTIHTIFLICFFGGLLVGYYIVPIITFILEMLFMGYILMFNPTFLEYKETQVKDIKENNHTTTRW
jgi:hypothetical protein